jgi:lipopolysaccharide transport system ATP-binding protein
MVAIEMSDVTVRFRVPRERVRTFKEFAINWLRGRVVYEELLALSRVSLTIRRGEAVGIIGRNGAGKSTFLKVIARVLRPTAGSVAVQGRVAPLLELGAGFDPELSGRENVFLNGAILGRSRREMIRRLPRIVEFAELEDFIDAPIRTYSSGMVARLGFAVATDVEPDILLVDEVLAVGDLEFQQKCLDRMHAFRARQATLVFVSHSPEMVLGLCERVLWFEGGRVVADGPAREVVDAYVSPHSPQAAHAAS